VWQGSLRSLGQSSLPPPSGVARILLRLTADRWAAWWLAILELWSPAAIGGRSPIASATVRSLRRVPLPCVGEGSAMGPSALATTTSRSLRWGTPNLTASTRPQLTEYPSSSSAVMNDKNGPSAAARCRPGTFSTNNRSGRNALTNRRNWRRSGRRTSSMDRRPFCFEKGWQGAQHANSRGSRPARATCGSSSDTLSFVTSARMKFASGKFLWNVLPASASRSIPTSIARPAFRNPALVPPQPQKKSKTRIGIYSTRVCEAVERLVARICTRASAMASGSSCSQTRNESQPAFERRTSVSLSRRRLASIFDTQNDELAFGIVL
jgi:hypothetical protein